MCRDFRDLIIVGFSGLKKKERAIGIWDRSATELSVSRKASQIAVEAKEDNRPLTSLTLSRNRKSLGQRGKTLRGNLRGRGPGEPKELESWVPRRNRGHSPCTLSPSTPLLTGSLSRVDSWKSMFKPKGKEEPVRALDSVHLFQCPDPSPTGVNRGLLKGIIHQMKGDYDTALKLHKTHLCIAQELSDYAAQGRAYGNMGNAYNALGMYDQAVKYHRQELQISMEVNDRASQASTHGNLAVAYQALGAHDRALQHYQNHLNIARELRDIQSEARALSNLGNFHCSRGEYVQAAPYYEQYLRLAPDLQDMEGEGKVCHNLGYAHYCLGNYQEAVKYYEQDLALAKDLHDKLSQAKAYCNLGLAFKALLNFGKAEECQKYLLSLAQSLNNSQAKFRALGNLGDIFICKKDINGAIKFYEQQLGLAHHVKDRRLEASAYAALGTAYRMIQKYDKALGYHTQELEVYQELSDLPGECRAHGHLAAVYMALGKYTMAFKCYEEQLDLGQKLKDPSLEAQVYGNMGITKMNMNVMEEAIGYFEQQLAMLQQLSGNESVLDRGRAYGNLGDCYEALGDYEEAIKYYEQYLSVAQSLNRMQDQAKAYRGLGNGHRAMGSLQQALVCFEKRLVVAHELGEAFNKAQAYGELGSLHSQLGNYEQAISCLERQLNIAREMKDRALESDAACGLGGVYQQMGEYDTALQYHQLDLQIAEETNNPTCQGRAYGNLGLTYESLGTFERAVVYQEQHLSIAAQMNDLVAKTVSYSSLGRTHHALQNYSQAVMYLQEVSQRSEFSSWHLPGFSSVDVLHQRAWCASWVGLDASSHELLQRARPWGQSDAEYCLVTSTINGCPQISLPQSPGGCWCPESQALAVEFLYLILGLRLAEQLGRREDEAKIRHGLGLSLWASGNLEEAQHQLYRASALFETIRHEAQLSTDYRLSLFDLQTSSYQALQRVLVSLGHHDEALAVAERGRTRAFADLLVERQTGQQDSDPYSPVTIDQILEMVNGQRGLVLYYSLAAGYLYSWLLAPGAGILKFHEHYLGDNAVENSSDFQAGSSTALPTATSSALEQHIAKHNFHKHPAAGENRKKREPQSWVVTRFSGISALLPVLNKCQEGPVLLVKPSDYLDFSHILIIRENAVQISHRLFEDRPETLSPNEVFAPPLRSKEAQIETTV
ncbi:hypothetical protein PANDA_020279 [Ailuropoda melanoleuca]|uniref:Uncharacterized protein n=1 Tax=Ailuropoda melanoleuca TaxID=9646 RepID=D2I3Z3_AILME|nr:hypothetical protein PANDA_020279 [Ailuropoda melanoleuca]